MKFTKYQGLGNDFLVADLRDQADSDLAQQEATVRALCDRRFGVGGDGLLPILPATSPNADARMRVLNADGSEAEMCGNGIRCLVKHLYEAVPGFQKPTLRIDTGAGLLSCDVSLEGGAVETVSVDMGPPRFSRGEIPMTGPSEERCVEQIIVLGDGFSPAITAVSMGNPHAMIFTDETGPALRELAERHGAELENHAWFPNRTNAEFVKIHSPEHIELVVWERGCGITLACGTGACATAVAACICGHSKPETDIQVDLLGGPLFIRVAEDYSNVVMRGPAKRVYEADVDLTNLLSSAAR
jgi:diaminopimelate epimerase